MFIDTNETISSDQVYNLFYASLTVFGVTLIPRIFALFLLPIALGGYYSTWKF